MATSIDILNEMCEKMNWDKEGLRASTHRGTAKAVQAELNRFNGLSDSVFAAQFKAMIDDIKMYSSAGATKISYKFYNRPTLENPNDETEPPTETTSAVEYNVMVRPGNATSYARVNNHGAPFKKMLGSSVAQSMLRELGYKVEKRTMQTGRKYSRIYDVVDVDWTENRK